MGNSVWFWLLIILPFSVFSSVISAYFTTYMIGRAIWKWQKIKEIKFKIYEDAVTALASHRAGSPDNLLISKTISMIQAYYSKHTFKSYVEAFNHEMKIDGVLNLNASQAHEKAINLLINELGLK